MSGGLFLGLELATEQLRASVVDEGLEVIAEVAVDFDGDLPQYLYGLVTISYRVVANLYRQNGGWSCIFSSELYTSRYVDSCTR